MLQNSHLDWSQKYLFRFVCWPLMEAMGRGWEEADFGILPGGPPMTTHPNLRVSGSIYRCVYLGSGGERVHVKAEPPHSWVQLSFLLLGFWALETWSCAKLYVLLLHEKQEWGWESEMFYEGN